MPAAGPSRRCSGVSAALDPGADGARDDEGITGDLGCGRGLRIITLSFRRIAPPASVVDARWCPGPAGSYPAR